MEKVIAWIKQPTTVAGISTIVGTLMGVATGATTWPAAVALLAGGIAAMALPDNSGAQTAIVQVAKDVVTAAEVIENKGK